MQKCYLEHQIRELRTRYQEARQVFHSDAPVGQKDRAQKPEGLSSSWKRTTLMVLAVTLHNIPEGMAVGLSFALAAQHGGDVASLSAAAALAIGMGIQVMPCVKALYNHSSFISSTWRFFIVIIS